MRLLYAPFSLLASILSARLGRAIFKNLWTRIDRSEPPGATTGESSMPKVVGAAALEAATMAGIAAAVNRVTASTFHYLFGVWPGKRKDES